MEGDTIIDIFDRWFKHYTEVSGQLAVMEESHKKSAAQVETLTKANTRLHTDDYGLIYLSGVQDVMFNIEKICSLVTIDSEVNPTSKYRRGWLVIDPAVCGPLPFGSENIDCCMLQETVSQCQQQLHIVSHLEDEVQQLKQQILEKDQALQSESDQNRAVLESTKKDHEAEKTLILANVKAEYDNKFADLDCRLKVEIDAKLSLQSHLQDMKKDRAKELSRITMEYESKLAKAQRQKAQYLQQQQQVLNQDILRKKMQHMKENYEQEIAILKTQIQDMKHTIESVQHGRQAKEGQMLFCEPQKQQHQGLQPQRSRGHTSQHDVKGASRYQSISSSKLKI